jgi:hypothetical protein
VLEIGDELQAIHISDKREEAGWAMIEVASMMTAMGLGPCGKGGKRTG